MADFTTSKVDGNTVDASEYNQLADLDNAVTSSGQTPSTGNLNQLGIAMAINAAGADFYSDSGTANAYVLTAIGTLKSPHAYFDGMRVRFRPDNANTGASTVNVATLGVKSIKRSDGTTATSTGDIPANADLELRYDLANGVFVLAASAESSLRLTTLSNKNILINGAMDIDQRNAGSAQTITAAAALAYSVDRWYAYSTGANVTGQRVAGTTPNQYNYQFTGAASVTKIGFAQRIEVANSQHLAGNTATLSVDLKNSLLTTVTWVASYANTANTFGSLASPTITQIATGTFTVSNTLTRFTANISIPSAAITGLQIEFSVAAQTSGTWTIGRAQLEFGSFATAFENKIIGEQALLCQRYFQKTYAIDVAPGTVTTEGILSYFADNVSMTQGGQWLYAPEMRATPTVTCFNPVTGSQGSGRQSSGIDRAFTTMSAHTSRMGRFYFAVGATPTTSYITWHATMQAEL